MEVDFYSTLESVREKIERGEKYYALLNDKSKWNQYCASLYAIEDAQCAIEAFENFHYVREKALEGGAMAEFGIGRAKAIVQSCKEALNDRYGDWKNKDSFRYEIEDIDEIFKLLNEPKGMLRERIDYYLTEILFIKLGNLEKYAEEIDEEFRIE